MKRFGTAVLLLLFVAAVGVRLSRRAVDEHRNSSVALIIDWGEIRDLAARTGDSNEAILDALKSLGATGFLLPPLTLDDLLAEGRIVSKLAPGAASPFDTAQILFKDSALAPIVQQELAWRGVGNVHVTASAAGAVLKRDQGTFDSIKDVDAGFDPALIQLLESKGLIPILRLNADPWIKSTDVPTILTQDPTLSHARAILF